MRLDRLAGLYALKYKVAVNAKDLEASIRNQIDALYLVVSKTHNILRACAQSEASKPTTPEEAMAVEGYKFCQEVVSKIDYLKANKDKLSLDVIKKTLQDIKTQVEISMFPNFGGGQKATIEFPQVSALIYQLIPTAKKHDRKLRDEQLGKARKGFSRIVSIVIGMLEQLRQLQGSEVEENIGGRFQATRAPLSESDIVSFIRQNGDQYGISTTDDWSVALTDDPQLKEQLTTVINALNRGQAPRDSADVKMQLAEIMRNHEERKSSNAHLFETTEE
jgi:hypothetical protein